MKKNLMFLILMSVTQMAFGLADEYRRNGECYLLIGERTSPPPAVYRVYTPTPADPNALPYGNTVLFNPGTSYGIYVDLNRNVYTFTSDRKDSTYGYDANWQMRVLMKPYGGVCLYGAHCDTRRNYNVTISGVTENQCNKTVYTTYGPFGTSNYGNCVQPASALQWRFNPPRPWKSASDVGDSINWTSNPNTNSGIKLISPLDPKVDDTRLWNFESRNYCCTGTARGRDWWSVKFVKPDSKGYGYVPNNCWYQTTEADQYRRPGNLIYWQRSNRLHTYYDLKYWNKSFGVGGTNRVHTSNIGKIFDEIINRTKISACLNVVCMSNTTSLPFSALPKYVNLAMAPLSGNTYIYSRTKTSTEDGMLTINGTELRNVDSDSRVRGYSNDLTTKWVKVSTKSNSEDYIYLIGEKLINEWLAEKGIKQTVTLSSNADSTVCVSDQWWLEGGIVYVYEPSKKRVWQFVRNDTSGKGICSSQPKTINIGNNSDGNAIDAIGTDGDGNLYYTLTSYSPKQGITPNVKDNLYKYELLASDYGLYDYTLYMEREVFKTTYCKEFATDDSFLGHQIGEKIKIGRDQYLMKARIAQADATGFTINPTTEAEKTKASNISRLKALYGSKLTSGGPITEGSKDSMPGMTQLAVINVAKPPTMVIPEGGKGIVDIVGIAKDSSAGTESTLPEAVSDAKAESGDYPEKEVKQGFYTFRIENSPVWSGRNNIAIEGKEAYEGDKNNNGTTGGFLASLMNNSGSTTISPDVRYTWTIYKIQDQFGNVDKDASTPVRNSVESTSPRTDYYFRSGTYQILCTAYYRYYDYDVLPFGSTVRDIDNAIMPKTASETTKYINIKNSDGTTSNVLFEIAKPAPTSSHITEENFKGLQPWDPKTTTCTILRVNRQTPPPSGETVDIQMQDPSAASVAWRDPQVSGSGASQVKYHVVDEQKAYNYRMKGDSDPSKYLPALYKLPTITDSNLVPGSLQWVDNMPVQYEWTLNLTLPDGTAYPAQEKSKNSNSPSDVAVSFTQSFPTDPVFGELTCKAFRRWTYETNLYDDVGNYLTTETVEGNVEYNGSVKVLVLDKTPPEIVQINGRDFDGSNPLDPIYLGVTGGLATDKYSYGDYSNPNEITVLVRDNNMYANLTTESALTGHLHNRQVKQNAQFFFERTATKELFPTQIYNATSAVSVDNNNGEGVKYFSSPGLKYIADETTNGTYKIKRSPQSWKSGDIYSYIKYTFSISDWKYLQKSPYNNDTLKAENRWPPDFANNSVRPSYESQGSLGKAHKGYAVFFLARDSSGNAKRTINSNGSLGEEQKIHIGNVWIKDNIPPVVYAKVRNYINRNGDGEIQPDNVISQYLDPTPKWGRLGNLTNWYVQNADFKYANFNDLNGIPANLTKENKPETIKLNNVTPKIVQEGMEIFIDIYAQDNVFIDPKKYTETSYFDSIGVPGLSVKISGPKGLYAEKGVKQLGNGAGITMNKDKENKSLRVMLQRSGVYEVELTGSDTAKNFDGSDAAMTRTVKFGIIAAPTSSNIYTIDKKNRPMD